MMVRSMCFNLLLLYEVASFLNQKCILEESEGFKNFLMFVPETLKGDVEVNALISLLYRKGNISGYIFSTQDAKKINLFPNMYKPFVIITLIRSKNDVETFEYFYNSVAPFQRMRVIFAIKEFMQTGYEASLRNIFYWCWTNGIMDVLIILQIGHVETAIFTYDPYPEFSIVKLDGNSSRNAPFSAKRKNLQGFKVKTIFLNQPPRVLKVRQGSHVQLTGYGVEIIKNFINKLNGTCVDIADELSWYHNYTHIADLVRKHEIEFAPYCLFSNEIYHNTSTFTRNLINLRASLVVPKGRSLTPALYVVRPFQPETWIVFFGVVIYMSVTEFVFQCAVSGSRDFLKAVCNAILGITLRPMHLFSSEQSCGLRFIRTHAIAIGFIFTNLYLAYMSSFMITGIFEPDVISLKDILRRRIQILIPSYFEISKTYSGRLPNLFREVPSEIVYAHSNNFNQSYAFFAQSDYIEMLLAAQRMFERPVYHVTKFGDLGPSLKGFVIWENSPLYEEMDTYLMQISLSGLLGKWRSDAVKATSRSVLNISQFLTRTHLEPEPLGTMHLSLILLLYISGNLLAFTCAISECFFFSIRKRFF